MDSARRGALIRYCLGMTGNQDTAGRAQARLDAIYARLDRKLDRGMDALDAVPLEPGDVMAVQRYVRSVELVARAARAVAALIVSPGRSRAVAAETEDDMNDDDRDDSPETLDRIRSELESRLDRLHAVIEAKRVACLAGRGRVVPIAGEPARAT
jgi:hypothetical protein